MLKTFDIALIPFKINDLTRFVSPTKTPEYLAGGKPVVSTALPDVVADYADVVMIASSTTEFIEAVTSYLSTPPDPVHLQRIVGDKSLTWSKLALAMEADLQSMLNRP